MNFIFNIRTTLLFIIYEPINLASDGNKGSKGKFGYK